jgi:hypothetical protein
MKIRPAPGKSTVGGAVAKSCSHERSFAKLISPVSGGDCRASAAAALA